MEILSRISFFHPWLKIYIWRLYRERKIGSSIRAFFTNWLSTFRIYRGHGGFDWSDCQRAPSKKKKKKRIYWNICNIGGIIGTTRSRNRFLADNFYFHSIKFSSTKFYYENIINQNEHPSKRISVTLLLLLSSRIFPKGKNPRGIIAWNEARSRMETERKTRWGREEGDRFVISFSSSRGFRLGLLMNSD